MLKKPIYLILLASYLTIMTTEAVATVAQEAAYQETLSALYLDGSLGWASTDWRNSLNYIFPSQTATQFNHLNSGFTYGGDLGYQFNHYFSLEVGALGLPNVSYTIQSKTHTYTSNDTGSISNWLVDLAGKVTLPIPTVSGLDIFGKFGVAYRAGNFTDEEILTGTASLPIQPTVFDILEPILGGGLQYRLNKHWAINGQYLFVPYGILSTTILGPNGADHISIPTAQIVTGGISFNF